MKALVRSAAALLLLAPLVHRYIVDPLVSKPELPGRRVASLDDIRDRGELRLATVAGTASYFFHHGVPAGFEYELLRPLAAALGVQLRAVVVRSAEEAGAALASGRADVATLPEHQRPVEAAVRAVRYLRHGRSPEEVRSQLPPTGGLFVRRDSPELVAAVDGYLYNAGRDGTVKVLYERYFADGTPHRPIPAAGGAVRLSEFDGLIARHADAEGIDWRLVAAVISAESRFDAAAVSPKGATGLMQLMPSAAVDLAVDELDDPDKNVRAGIRYLRRLMKIFPERRGRDTLPIVLAAYLIGPGHVLDARQLARDLGYDPERWRGGLDQALPLLENPAYYERTRLGYAQGRLAVRYVERVLENYEAYKRHVGVPAPRERRSEKGLDVSTRRSPGERIRM